MLDEISFKTRVLAINRVNESLERSEIGVRGWMYSMQDENVSILLLISWKFKMCGNVLSGECR